MTSVLPKRVIFNFVARCNMACSFCYVPFDGLKASEETSLQVLRMALAWDLEAIVFGGGDPLIYPFTTELLAEAKAWDSRMFVQLDTNAYLTSRECLLSAARQVNLVGLPIDGITPAVSTAMRGAASHGLRPGVARAAAVDAARPATSRPRSSADARPARPRRLHPPRRAGQA